MGKALTMPVLSNVMQTGTVKMKSCNYGNQEGNERV